MKSLADKIFNFLDDFAIVREVKKRDKADTGERMTLEELATNQGLLESLFVGTIEFTDTELLELYTILRDDMTDPDWPHLETAFKKIAAELDRRGMKRLVR